MHVLFDAILIPVFIVGGLMMNGVWETPFYEVVIAKYNPELDSEFQAMSVMFFIIASMNMSVSFAWSRGLWKMKIHDNGVAINGIRFIPWSKYRSVEWNGRSGILQVKGKFLAWTFSTKYFCPKDKIPAVDIVLSTVDCIQQVPLKATEETR